MHGLDPARYGIVDYSLVGRASRPIYLRGFLGGGRRSVGFKPGEKVVALEVLARSLEAHQGRRVKDDVVARLTTTLCDEVARMRAILERLEPGWYRAHAAGPAHGAAERAAGCGNATPAP